MPRKKLATAIQNHYSKALKECIIYQAYTLDKSSKEIAHDLNMPLRVVQHVKEMWAEIGEVCRNCRHKGRAPLMSPNNCKVMSEKSWMVCGGIEPVTSRPKATIYQWLATHR